MRSALILRERVDCVSAPTSQRDDTAEEQSPSTWIHTGLLSLTDATGSFRGVTVCDVAMSHLNLNRDETSHAHKKGPELS